MLIYDKYVCGVNMAVIVSVSLNFEDYEYLKSSGGSPSEIFRKAIQLFRTGELELDRFLYARIKDKDQIILKLQKTITELGGSAK